MSNRWWWVPFIVLRTDRQTTTLVHGWKCFIWSVTVRLRQLCWILYSVCTLIQFYLPIYLFHSFEKKKFRTLSQYWFYFQSKYTIKQETATLLQFIFISIEFTINITHTKLVIWISGEFVLVMICGKLTEMAIRWYK